MDPNGVALPSPTLPNSPTTPMAPSWQTRPSPTTTTLMCLARTTVEYVTVTSPGLPKPESYSTVLIPRVWVHTPQITRTIWWIKFSIFHRCFSPLSPDQHLLKTHTPLMKKMDLLGCWRNWNLNNHGALPDWPGGIQCRAHLARKHIIVISLAVTIAVTIHLAHHFLRQATLHSECTTLITTTINLALLPRAATQAALPLLLFTE